MSNDFVHYPATRLFKERYPVGGGRDRRQYEGEKGQSLRNRGSTVTLYIEDGRTSTTPGADKNKGVGFTKSLKSS